MPLAHHSVCIAVDKANNIVRTSTWAQKTNHLHILRSLIYKGQSSNITNTINKQVKTLLVP